jgi:predicted metal-dependent enzyme (double-stranded beta helix superfamily)
MSHFIHDLESLHDILDYQYNIHGNFINLTSIVKKYIGIDWIKYIKYNNNKYNRIRLDNLSNSKFEIYIICWKPMQLSPIHDHSENGCIMKVLDGSLKETLCGPPLQRAPITLPGSKRKVMKIANIFFVKETENGLERIEDNHSHAMEYRHTDEVCPTQRTDATNAEKEKVQIMMHQARLAAGELSNSQSSNFVVEE